MRLKTSAAPPKRSYRHECFRHPLTVAMRHDHQDPAAREVVKYREASWHGYGILRQRLFLSINDIISMQSIVVGNDAGIRKQPGTTLVNDATGEVIYTPPPRKRRSEYYELLREVAVRDRWEPWINYYLVGIERTAKDTIRTIRDMKNLLDRTVQMVGENGPPIYSKELVEALFEHPYCKNEFVERKTGVEREAASRHLHALAETAVLELRKVGRENIFINTELKSFEASLVFTAVSCGIVVYPVFLGVRHPLAPRNSALRPGAIERAALGTVAECFEPISLPGRVPLIDDHLHRHPAAPDALQALALIRAGIEPPVSPGSVRLEIRRRPRKGRSGLRSGRTLRDHLDTTRLVEFRSLEPLIGNRRSHPTQIHTGRKAVFLLRRLSDRNGEIPVFTCYRSRQVQHIAEIIVMPLVE